MSGLSPEAVLLLETLNEAHEQAVAAKDETLSWRELGLFTTALCGRLEQRGLIHSKRELGKDAVTYYSISSDGLRELDEMKKPDSAVKRKPGRPAKPRSEDAGEQQVARTPKPIPKTTFKVRETTVVPGTGNTTPAPTPPSPIYRAATADDVTPKPSPLPLILGEHQPDGCKDCVYKQALEILARRLPGVNDPVEALKVIDTLGR